MYLVRYRALLQYTIDSTLSNDTDGSRIEPRHGARTDRSNQRGRGILQQHKLGQLQHLLVYGSDLGLMRARVRVLDRPCDARGGTRWIMRIADLG